MNSHLFENVIQEKKNITGNCHNNGNIINNNSNGKNNNNSSMSKYNNQMY